MSDLKDKFVDIANILKEFDLDVEKQEDGLFRVLDSTGIVNMYDIENLDELHSCLLGYEEGWDAAVKFHKVVKY